MPMPMRGNIIHGISAIITMMSCLCASVFSNQPSLCVCVCVCVWQRARQCRQEEEEHTQGRRESVCVCEEGERETASQMNQPTNQLKQRLCVCLCVKKK